MTTGEAEGYAGGSLAADGTLVLGRKEPRGFCPLRHSEGSAEWLAVRTSYNRKYWHGTSMAWMPPGCLLPAPTLDIIFLLLEYKVTLQNQTLASHKSWCLSGKCVPLTRASQPRSRFWLPWTTRLSSSRIRQIPTWDPASTERILCFERGPWPWFPCSLVTL